MKRIGILLIIMIMGILSLYSQSILVNCQIRDSKTFTDTYTECYVQFNTSQKTIRVTYPSTLTLYIKELESLSAGSVKLNAQGSDGKKYLLTFFDLTPLTGKPLWTFRILYDGWEKKSNWYYYNFYNPDEMIPILNKILNGL